MPHENGYDEFQVEADVLLAVDYYMPTIIANILKNHFSSSPANRFPAIRNLVYQPTINQGAAYDTPQSLSINVWNELNYTAANATPALIIKDNDAASRRIGMGDQGMIAAQANNNTSFERVWASSCTVFCITPLPGLAKLLGWEVGTHLEECATQLKDLLKLYRIEVSSIGATRPIKEFDKNFAVPVTVEYTFVRSWTLAPAEPTLQHVQQNFETQL